MWFVEVTLFCFIGNTPWIATGWSLLSSTSCVKSKRKQVGPMRFLKLSTGILNARQIQTYTIWTKNYRPTNHLEKLKVPSSSATEAHVKGTLYALCVGLINISRESAFCLQFTAIHQDELVAARAGMFFNVLWITFLSEKRNTNWPIFQTCVFTICTCFGSAIHFVLLHRPTVSATSLNIFSNYSVKHLKVWWCWWWKVLKAKLPSSS